LEDLIARTHDEHYEAFRKESLFKLGYYSDDGQKIGDVFSQKKAAHEKDLAKMEEEMRQAFVARVKDKEIELQQAAAAVKARYDRQMEMLRHEAQLLQQRIGQLDGELEQVRSGSVSKKKEKEDKKKSK
jgi:septin family protein